MNILHIRIMAMLYHKEPETKKKKKKKKKVYGMGTY